MAEAAVSFAVETLGNLLIEKAVFLKGVKEEVEWLRNELRRMQCFLKDAAKKQSDSDSIRNWISEIREAAHDAEDAIEMFVLSVESRGTVARFASFPKHLYHLNNVGKEIESIRKKLEQIEHSRVRYGIQDLGDDHHHRGAESSRSQLDLVESRRRIPHWQKDKQVVGMEKDVELLLGKAIFEKSEGLSVAAISGMGGIGKSTLAGKIYNHPDVVRRFEYRVWVVVSSEFTPQDIMKQILLQLGISLDDLKRLESVDDNLGRQENMKKELHRRLTGKRYFIVLDDVWEAAHWESLSGAFPNGDEASRLLLTSRNEVVTMHDGYVHIMKVLDAKQSWELFLKNAFVDNTNTECPEELKDIGEEILRKCGGLALAICVVGSLLAKKARLKSEWQKVVREMKHHLHRSGDINTISAILELSYQNLPPDLKACFLCLAFSREDATLKVKNLVHIWVAQGFVRQEVVRQGEVMEDVAREYLNELISRNMVQVKEMKYDQVKACHMHDLIRDLCLRKAKEEIDFEEVRDEGDSHEALDKPRHCAIYYSGESSVYFTTERNHCLRSLFIHADADWELETTVNNPPSSYWKSFELVRLLDLGLIIMSRFPKAIGGLTGLRYLKMTHSVDGSAKLPRSWAKLKNLEVLHLKNFEAYGGTLIIIDKVIVKMDSLRHLYVTSFCSRVALQGMRNLQTLSKIRMKDADLWHIQGMSNVSKLGFDMSQTSSPTKLFTCLATLENLVFLTLTHRWRHEDSFQRRLTDIDGIGALHRITHLKLAHFFYEIRRWPVDFPPNLSHLTIKDVCITGDPMPVLQTLPKLLYLQLSGVRGIDQFIKMVVSPHGFPNLRVLHVDNLSRLIALKIEQDAMPELKQFIVSRCQDLDTQNFPEHVISAMAN